jgi:hypothetical protein
MPAPKLVKFDSAGGVPCYYARVNAAYGDLSKCTPSRVRRISPRFLPTLSGAIQEVAWACYGGLGELVAITSGGAAVPQSAKRGPRDRHVRGIAFDLGGLHWKHHVLTCLEVAKPPRDRDQLLIYLAVESTLRKWFGTVLGVHHNKAHHNHWHVDTGTPVGYWSQGFGSTTRVRFVQEALTHVWRIDCGTPDGDQGPRTNRAIKDLRAELKIGELGAESSWLQFLTLTTMKAMQLR